jgi:glutamyl-tRNA synthetase
MLITRLAPSPTGALHLGNARTFLINWLLARQNGWRIALRIEDLDGPRIKTGADQMILEDLAYLGLDWDEGPTYQSSNQAKYQKVIEEFLAKGLAYPCICTRREVDLAASAPHAEDGASIYPGTCRGRFPSIAAARAESGKNPAIRFAAPDRMVEFDDGFRKHQAINVAKELGDFVIAKSDGTAAYQLAVVLDDLEADVGIIVRGDDLLDSTPRQILIYEAMGAADRIPRYIHLPLVVGADGRRLAKRHGDTRLSHYRQRGVSRAQLLSLLARWCGIEGRSFRHPRELVDRFQLEKLPPKAIIFDSNEIENERLG